MSWCKPYPRLQAFDYNRAVGWGFRKSFGSSPFRVNLSKSGVGFSTGVKGFRVSTNRRGTFVNMGTGGVYYRKKIGGPYGGSTGHPAHSPPGAGPTWQQQTPLQPLVGAVPTADATRLVDQRSEQLISAINEAIALPGALRILLPFAIISTIIAAIAVPVMLYIAGALWILPLLFVADADRKARTYSLLYELEPAAEAQWNDLTARLARLASSSSLWRVAANVTTNDQRRNAGAQTLVSRRRANLTQTAPPYISTNINSWCLDLGDQKLCFLPDRVLVLQGKTYGAVEYDRLNISCFTEQFIESEVVPHDALRVGTTYQYVNKNGTPDRRFANNRELPIMQYAKLVLSSISGLNIHMQVSSIAAAQAIAGFSVRSAQPHASGNGSNQARFQSTTHTGYPQGGQQYVPGNATGWGGSSAHTQSAPGPKLPPSSTTSAHPKCYAVLGLKFGCGKDEAAAVYRALARKYHPDLLSNLPRDLVEIAEERMKEVNVAYGEIRSLNGW